MYKENKEVLDCFWLPPNFFNTCVSGVNQYTIGTYSKVKRNLDANDYFQEHILPLLKTQAKQYHDNIKYLHKSKLYPEGFREIVNNALKEIYANRKGYVFSTKQLIEILRFIPDINVFYEDDMYFLWK